jgi:hypothetical protein
MAAAPDATPAAVSSIWFWLGAVLFVVLAVAFWGYLVPRTNIVRDQGPDLGPSTFKTYSLSRCQMALWFFVVLGSFTFIALSTGDIHLSNTALWLIGISFGTTAAAKAVDSGKVTSAQARESDLAPQLTDSNATLQVLQDLDAPGPEQQIQLEAAQSRVNNLVRQLNDAQQSVRPSASQSLVPDLLTDDGGTALHRFQMAVWTIVIVAIFLHQVWVEVKMPELPAQLLGLMGVSNGMYVGLKVPEKA